MPGERLGARQLEAVKRHLEIFVGRYDSQTEAAAALSAITRTKVTQGTISGVLGGNRGVGADFLIKLADALELSLDEIVGRGEESEDAELEAALRTGDWPGWLHDAARSRRNLHGTMTREQWAAWMRGMVTADASTLAAVRPSAQELSFERARARGKAKPRVRKA